MNLFRLFFIFVRIGAIGFGGGYAMLSIIGNEMLSLGMTVEQFADLTALDLVVPGPIAINAATYVGFLYDGIWGALAATLAICVPCYVIVLTVMFFLDKFRKNSFMQAFLSGVKPAAVGLIAASALMIAAEVLFPAGQVNYLCIFVFAAVGVAAIKFKIDPIVLTLASGAFGAFFLR